MFEPLVPGGQGVRALYNGHFLSNRVSRMRKALVGAAALAVIAAASALSFWAGGRNAASTAGPGGAPKAAAAPPGVVVEATKVAVVSLPQALTAVGSLRSDETVILRPEIAGRVSQILFREGEPVPKGQVLVKSDN